MNTQITLDHLDQLNLHGMARAYQAVLSMPVPDQPSINQFMARMAEAEIQDRTHKKTEKLYWRVYYRRCNHGQIGS